MSLRAQARAIGPASIVWATLKTSTATACEGRELVRKVWSRFRKIVPWPMLGVIHVYRGTGWRWLVHIHLLVFGKEEHAMVRREIEKASEGARANENAWTDPVPVTPETLGEKIDYMVRGALDLPDDPTAIRAWLRATKGLRAVVTSRVRVRVRDTDKTNNGRATPPTPADVEQVAERVIVILTSGAMGECAIRKRLTKSHRPALKDALHRLWEADRIHQERGPRGTRWAITISPPPAADE